MPAVCGTGNEPFGLEKMEIAVLAIEPHPEDQKRGAYSRGCVKNMKTRCRLICRSSRGRKFYCMDTTAGHRTSLLTTDENEARQLIEAKNAARRQPKLNLQLARAYLTATDPAYMTRSWQNASTAGFRPGRITDPGGAGRH
jgi:hypothetical protein